MKLAHELNETINKALGIMQIPLEIVADYVAQYNVDDLWAAYCSSDRFERFLQPYNSFKDEFNKFYEENEEIVDDFLLNVAGYYPEFIQKAKKENLVFNAFIEGSVWNTLENKGFVDDENHMSSNLTPFFISHDNRRCVTDSRNNEVVEKCDSKEEANAAAIKLNKEYCLEQLKG